MIPVTEMATEKTVRSIGGVVLGVDSEKIAQNEYLIISCSLAGDDSLLNNSPSLGVDTINTVSRICPSN